ncbi:hypothetical protein MLD38_027187 [Melastoma candidum]|uniref:Uncharacterized protein n=1 Tax=Melastoma candidum TaxID=119954 RepID=A0ACB9P404_9MYRT|nr:hypothetical protein MLD38_027187 [Melastoma candidum]
MLERLDRAVANCRADAVLSGESVTSWKVWQQAEQQAAAAAGAGGWEWQSPVMLGIQPPMVPSMKLLMDVESKINAFIHCFIAACRITALYDLEVAICNNEGVQRFEDLELGPFLKYPLVVHYFSLADGVAEVCRITGEEVVSYLCKFMFKRKGWKRIEVDDLLKFIAKEKSVDGVEKLGLRINNLGLHISFILGARRAEETRLRTFPNETRENDDDGSEPHGGEGATAKQFDCAFSSSEDDKDYYCPNRNTKHGEEDNVAGMPVDTSSYNNSLQPSEAADGGKGEELSPVEWLKKDLSEREAILMNSSNYNKKGKRSKQAKKVLDIVDRLLEKCVMSPKKKRKMNTILNEYPLVVLLNVAVVSVKCGMLDDLYDTIGKEMLSEISKPQEETAHSSEGAAVVISSHGMQLEKAVAAEDIAAAFSACFQTGITVGSNHMSTVDEVIDLLKRLVESESLLAKQFSVPEFKSLGCGDYFSFLQKNISLLPLRLQMLMKVEVYDESSRMVCMFQHQLLMLASQAMTGIWSGKAVLKNMISDLLRRQFPTVSFEIEEACVKYLLRVVEEYKSNAISTSILFSQTLMMTTGNESYASNEIPEIGARGALVAQKAPQQIRSSLSQEAVTLFLNAPMLTDLSLWSHWDVRFAPGLGPLMDWLMNEFNVKELLFLATKDGKLVRIDGTATVDSFLQSALQVAPYHMAVQLVSILAVNGGEKLAPLSLLKRYSCHAFDAILNQYNGETDLLKSTCILGRPSASSFGNSAGNKLHDGSNADVRAAVASRFFLDCLGYFPSEFCTFAADVLLYGIRSIYKNAPSSILSACKANGERILLHDIGLILGITEWINDYHVFSSAASTDLLEPPAVSYPKAKASQQNMVMPDKHYEGKKLSSPKEGENASGQTSKYSKVNSADHRGVISALGTLNGSTTEDFERGDADLIIQSIRRDEFGLNDNLPNTQRDLLRKQHDRLGRALHCLSRELYSQDSHFLLELVQNADDNKYPANAHPTLAFILQASGIVVLNNEKGFSSENIRALCDVGNSTKKGSRSGYIGKKGIGFKSVFRITDAPEIHSNGFHVKYDIRDGEIGFVLPTLVPAANMSLYERLAATEDDDKEIFWKTCIVLPFKEKMLEGGDKNGVVSMFSDIHPALLLFLRQLHCIKFINVLENSVVVMRKEALIGGVVRISYGKEAMDWFVARQELQASMDHDDARITEIALAFGLQESADGKYVPCLATQPVFAFLPLRTYGLRFILQGDFVLPSSREEVDGDSAWNQWLLSEIPSLFIRAQQSFCSLPCFKDNLGHAITVYMSYVPLMGEVHGFFSGLPRLILSKLRLSNCLILEGDDATWVPPCKVLRNWSEHDRNLLPAEFLKVHLGLGFLNRDIVLSDQLARSLGVQEFGLPTLVQVMESLCQKDNALRSMGLCWLSAWLNAVHRLHTYSPKGLRSLEADTDILDTLRTLPFIPLSDGTFSCTTEGDIWFHCDIFASENDGVLGMDAFPNLYASLRIVNPTFLSSSSADTHSSHTYSVDNIMRMLTKIGVKPLSAHEIIKAHILPAMHNETNVKPKSVLFIEFLCFIFVHFQSTCCSCHDEREYLLSELRERAFLVTNYGCKRLSDVPVHFTEQYGCPAVTKKLLKNINMQWHEVDSIYLKHPSNRFIVRSKKKWKEFLREVGVTEFVKVARLDRNALDIVVTSSEDRVSSANAVDWESAELVNLLSLLTSNKDLSGSRYLLEILDTLWDDCFIDKTMGYYDDEKSTTRLHFTSSFMKSISGCPWVASSMDDELHYPTELFHDCDSVRCILGSVAPYAVPKVKSVNLLSSIGFKTKVTIEDAVKMLRAWRSLPSFKASLSAMTKLYTFMWKEIGIPRPKIIEELISEPFIFMPSSAGLVNEDEIFGTFLCPNEVHWHDSVGICDLMEANDSSSDSSRGNKHPIRTLCGVYPGLMDFFVNACGVLGMPSYSAHVQMLQSLAETSLPSQAAKQIFRIFLALADEAQHGEVKPDEVLSTKESLRNLEFRVLPTLNDKWVSMHPSYGLVCWCDDEKLAEEFKIVDGVTLIFLGEDSDNKKEISPTNLSSFMHALGIPALSEVLTREAINYGLVYSDKEACLMEWALPYAQRYIRHLHPKRYAELRISRICDLSQLRIVVVEKLFYRNVVKKLGITSGKRWEVSSLLQGDTLFATRDSDTHSLYLEVSHALFGRSAEVHFANFLQLITKMLESGCTTEQVELFVAESQKLPEIPKGEVKWSVYRAGSSCENHPLPKNSRVPLIKKPTESPAERKGRDVPKWWSAPRCAFPPSILNKAYVDPSVAVIPPPTSPIDLTIPDCGVTEKPMPTSPVDYTVSDRTVGDPIIPFVAPELEDEKHLTTGREKLRTGEIDPTQAMIVGRRGEHLAFRHLAEKWGLSLKWVNEDGETGLPYDIIAWDDKLVGDVSRYVEVKTTKSAGKDWFSLSVNEWQFAIALGERYYIAHVLLEGEGAKRIVEFRNPTELCRMGKLSLAIVMPAHKEAEEEPLAQSIN